MEQTEEQRRDLDAEFHKSMARLMLDYGKIEYQDFLETWRDIERKAQGTVAIAGIFIAGIFVLMDSWNEAPEIATAGLALVVLLFSASILCSIRALAISGCPSLRDSAVVFAHAEAVLSAGDNAQARGRIRCFVNEVANDFTTTSRGLGARNGNKSSWVERAQICLALGVAISTVLLIGTLYGGW